MKNQLLYFLLFFGLFYSCNSEDYLDSDYNGAFTNNGAGSINENSEQLLIKENEFIKVSEEPLSTFSIDADGASYANMRKEITQGRLPYGSIIRTEEFINYFNMDYPFTETEHPISLNGELSECPWNTAHRLMRIGIQGKELPNIENIPTNFVYLIDVSGSMSADDKLGLLQSGFKKYTETLDENDRISIVTYAGKNKSILESEKGNSKNTIIKAIDKLSSGGGTNGANGIITAYELAEDNFIVGGNNRIIIGTDGDFNIGISDKDELVKLIEEKRDKGIFLTVLGVGQGHNDSALEQIANNGNGTYEYIDNEDEIMKVFIHEKSKFFTVAKDVKVQVNFNENIVEKYRLIGYENRLLANEDFEDDEKDAGEIGADQNITALYEIIPAKFIENKNEESFLIDFRYKEPDSDISELMELKVYDNQFNFAESSDQMKIAASVASYGMILLDSSYKGDASFDKVISWANMSNLSDPHGYIEEFKELVSKASKL